MKYEVAAMGEMDGGGNGRAAPDNRVIFTRDLGGDFAREENAASLFRLSRLPCSLFSFDPPALPRKLPFLHPFYLGHEIRPVGAISMYQRVCYFLPVCYSEAARRTAWRQIATPLRVLPFTESAARSNVCSRPEASRSRST